MKRLTLFVILLFVPFANSQENWVRHQEDNSRVALFVEASNNQEASYRGVARIFANATVGDPIFWLNSQGLSTSEFTAFNCEIWQWQGVLSNSLVFEVSKYSLYVQPSDTYLGSFLSMYKQERVGSKSWGESLFSMCNTGRTDVDDNDVEVSQIYIQLPSTPTSPILLTPSSLWNRAFLSLDYNQDFQDLDIDFRF